MTLNCILESSGSMKKFIKNNYKYVITFIVSFILLWFFGIYHNYNDPLANYCFSHAFIRGEIPYLDFNTISTPLYIFYQSIWLLICDNFNMFLLGQALLITITFSLLYKLYGKKVYLYLLVTCISITSNIIGTYNYMCFFMMIVIIYLEKKYSDKDYLIGICISLAILSKHTVGVFFIIPSIIFYIKDHKKILKRFIGILIPISIFLIYLILTKSLYSFIDLCILGLFDFSKRNGVGAGKINAPFFLILSILLLIVSILITIKNKKEISNYYLFFGIFFVVPLFDFSHTMMYFNCVLAMLIPYIKINDKLIKNISIITSVLILFIISTNLLKEITILKEKHFEYAIVFNDDYNETKIVYEYFSKFDDPLIIGYTNMLYNIINDKDIDYFSVPLYGNFGYNGINKMIEKISSYNYKIFIVSKKDYNNKRKDSQYCKEIAKYIMDNYKKIDSKYGYEVYYKEL